MSWEIAIYWIIESFRYLWNLFFLILHPIALLLGQNTLDSIDFLFFQHTGYDRNVYDRADKSADLAFYISCILFFSFYWNTLWYSKILVFGFLFRSIGNIIFLASLADWSFIAFPNVASSIMLLYVTLDFFRKDRKWLLKHYIIHFILLAIAIGLTMYLEIKVWGNGNNLIGPPRCRSTKICLQILWFPIVLLFLLLFFITYNKSVHVHDEHVKSKLMKQEKKIHF